jgi:hypothetical protein
MVLQGLRGLLDLPKVTEAGDSFTGSVRLAYIPSNLEFYSDFFGQGEFVPTTTTFEATVEQGMLVSEKLVGTTGPERMTYSVTFSEFGKPTHPHTQSSPSPLPYWEETPPTGCESLEGPGTSCGADQPPPASLTPLMTAAFDSQAGIGEGSNIIEEGGFFWFAVAQLVDEVPNDSSGGEPMELRIYRWSGTSWTEQATVQGGGHGSFSNTVGSASGISGVDITGSAEPDFLVGSVGADTQWLTVFSDATGNWEAVPFDDIGGPTVGESIANVIGSDIEVLYNCGCSVGPDDTADFHYMNGAFVPVGSPSSCAPVQLATAANVYEVTAGREPPSDENAYGEMTGFTCAGGYAVADTITAASGNSPDIQSALMVFQVQASHWAVLGTSERFPLSGVPPASSSTLATQFNELQLNQSYLF